jgi:hypothetical protein
MAKSFKFERAQRAGDARSHCTRGVPEQFGLRKTARAASFELECVQLSGCDGSHGLSFHTPIKIRAGAQQNKR